MVHWVNKENVVYIHYGILLGNKNLILSYAAKSVQLEINRLHVHENLKVYLLKEMKKIKRCNVYYRNFINQLLLMKYK